MLLLIESAGENLKEENLFPLYESLFTKTVQDLHIAASNLSGPEGCHIARCSLVLYLKAIHIYLATMAHYLPSGFLIQPSSFFKKSWSISSDERLSCDVYI